jgi:hypothetical protein
MFQWLHPRFDDTKVFGKGIIVVRLYSSCGFFCPLIILAHRFHTLPIHALRRKVSDVDSRTRTDEMNIYVMFTLCGGKCKGIQF